MADNRSCSLSTAKKLQVILTNGVVVTKANYIVIIIVTPVDFIVSADVPVEQCTYRKTKTL